MRVRFATARSEGWAIRLGEAVGESVLDAVLASLLREQGVPAAVYAGTAESGGITRQALEDSFRLVRERGIPGCG